MEDAKNQTSIDTPASFNASSPPAQIPADKLQSALSSGLFKQ